MNDIIAVQSVCIGFLMLSAYFFGRFTRQLRLGQTIGQLIGGVFVGPYFLEALGFLNKPLLTSYCAAFDSFHFIVFTFLGVIAFALGEEMHFDRFKKVGASAAIISLVQGGFTCVCIT